jgi:hypothetical protein
MTAGCLRNAVFYNNKRVFSFSTQPDNQKNGCLQTSITTLNKIKKLFFIFVRDERAYIIR